MEHTFRKKYALEQVVHRSSAYAHITQSHAQKMYAFYAYAQYTVCLYFDGSMPNALAQCYEASFLKILNIPMCAEHALILPRLLMSVRTKKLFKGVQ